MTQKEKIKHDRVLKLKKIGFWTLNIVSYILAGLFLIVLIISLSTPKKQNVSPRSAYRLYDNEITEVIREDIPNNVVYDDVEYKITLSANELNTYTWENLYTLVYNTIYEDISFDVDSFIYQYTSKDVNELSYQSSGDSLFFYGDVDTFNTDYGTNATLNYSFYSGPNGYPPFDTNIIIVGDNVVYNDLKTAIELDIQANETSDTQTIFESITQVLTNFISTLNSGVSAVINLFWNSTTSQLTLLGNLTTIVIGVAVCFFLFRLVIGLIRLRG